MSILTPMHPGRRITDVRLIPVEGNSGDDGATMSLSTPIASVQDGPRMTTPHFGSKKAAPFVKGGGRSSTHPNDAKGRKRKAAKAALAKSKSKPGGDYSVEQAATIDLGRTSFDPTEPRGTDGRWVRAAMRAASAGDLKALKHIQGQTGVDYDSGKTSYAERSKVYDIRAGALEAAAKAKRAGDTPKFAKSGPTWVPEKGARSKPEAQYLEAKNMLAKAVLSDNDRAIKKYQKNLAKKQWAFTQWKNAEAAAGRAGTFYSSPASMAARQSFRQSLGGPK